MDAVLEFTRTPRTKKLGYDIPGTLNSGLKTLAVMKDEPRILIGGVGKIDVSFSSTVVRNVDILFCLL